MVRQMGPGWAARRAGYSIKRQLGWFERRFPVGDWTQYSLARVAPGFSPDRLITLLGEAGDRFFISPKQRDRRKTRLNEVLPERAAAEIIGEAQAARSGVFRFFSHKEVALGWPPAWHHHSETGIDWPKAHWICLPEMGASDVKWLWEAGKFGFAYSLVRAYWLTGDNTYAETFWQLIESFKRESPPNCGAHWMCGQECAVRSLAWCFALFGFLDAVATTPERAASLIEMVAAHGERIESNVGFAILQKNNHAINEALALWTIGAMFPFIASSSRWEAKGREILEREAARQIYDDGSYIQHSMNYHRLILQSYSWAIRLGDLCDRQFSSSLRERFSRATSFLYQMTDERSGRVPNYGSNDGALLFRLDSCGFTDYRPALALAFWIAEKKRAYPQGAWDEPLVWMCGEEAFDQNADPPARIDLAAESGGYYTIRSNDTWGMIRCAEYCDRPAQADMLHVDLWWRGENLVADAGTYSYNSAPPWNNGLAGTGSHNTVQIDGLDQMERGPRFTWFYWNRGRVIRRWTDETHRVKLFEGQHDGYYRPLDIIHRRALMLVDGRVWIIVDDLRGKGSHRLSSQWLFPGAEVESGTGRSLNLRGPSGPFTVSFFTFSDDAKFVGPDLEIACGAPDSTRGWFSNKYLQKESALSVVSTTHCSLPVRLATIIALDDAAAVDEASSERFVASIGTDRLTVKCNPFPYADEDSIIDSVRLEQEGVELTILNK